MRAMQHLACTLCGYIIPTGRAWALSFPTYGRSLWPDTTWMIPLFWDWNSMRSRLIHLLPMPRSDQANAQP